MQNAKAAYIFFFRHQKGSISAYKAFENMTSRSMAPLALNNQAQKSAELYYHISMCINIFLTKEMSLGILQLSRANINLITFFLILFNLQAICIQQIIKIQITYEPNHEKTKFCKYHNVYSFNPIKHPRGVAFHERRHYLQPKV